MSYDNREDRGYGSGDSRDNRGYAQEDDEEKRRRGYQ